MQRFSSAVCKTFKSLAAVGLLAAMAAMAAMAAPAHADDLVGWIDAKPINEVWLNPGLVSYHWDRDKDLNGNNYGIGAEYRFNTVASVTAGEFNNSDRAISDYIGVYYQPIAIGPVRLGAVFGGFNGYPNYRNGNWFPAAIPTASYEYGRVGLNVMFVPSYQDRLYGALSFQLKLKVF